MKKFFCFFAVVISFMLFFSLSAHADTGPKPSVVVKFNGLSDEPCYATLLSKEDSVGPYTKWDEDENTQSMPSDTSELYYIYHKFGNYKDTDGFYFLQWHDECEEDKELNWSYYPPEIFKVLLYFPEKDTFAVSGICQRYAFDSYFTANINGESVNIEKLSDTSGNSTASATTSDTITIEEDYSYSMELLSFISRVAITVIIEVLLAFLFAYRGRKQILLIIAVNLITQIMLNVILNFNYSQLLSINYLVAELAVLAVELLIYVFFLNRLSAESQKRKRAVLYAITANAGSFFGGLVLSLLLPAIF